MGLEGTQIVRRTGDMTDVLTRAVGWVVAFVLVGLIVAFVYPHPRKDHDDEER